jgi:hypothetical protein
MKRTVIYWKAFDIERKREVKAELGITSVSVNGESEYKGELEKLEPYIKEGLIVIRRKDGQEVRRKKVCVNTIESKPNHGEEIGCGGRKRKVR